MTTDGMHTWDQGTVQSGDALLKYFRSGSAGCGKPPVVLVHGFTDSALYFTRLAELLADEWDVVAYDARGHGESSRLKASGGQFTDEIRVQDLVQVITTLGLDRPVLIGHSMGGATIAQTVAQHPTLIRGAVLEDPAWWEFGEDQREARREGRALMVTAWTQWISNIQAIPLHEAVQLRQGEEPLWNDVDLRTSLDARISFDVDLFGPFLPVIAPWRDSVKAFQRPVLLLIGSRSDRGAIITSEVANEAHALNKLLTWQQIEGAGHHLRYDQFDQFVAAVQAFATPLQSA
jgi:N-formylmaleamate deformylase